MGRTRNFRQAGSSRLIRLSDACANRAWQRGRYKTCAQRCAAWCAEARDKEAREMRQICTTQMTRQHENDVYFSSFFKEANKRRLSFWCRCAMRERCKRVRSSFYSLFIPTRAKTRCKSARTRCLRLFFFFFFHIFIFSSSLSIHFIDPYSFSSFFIHHFHFSFFDTLSSSFSKRAMRCACGAKTQRAQHYARVWLMQRKMQTMQRDAQEIKMTSAMRKRVRENAKKERMMRKSYSLSTTFFAIIFFIKRGVKRLFRSHVFHFEQKTMIIHYRLSLFITLSCSFCLMIIFVIILSDHLFRRWWCAQT